MKGAGPYLYLGQETFGGVDSRRLAPIRRKKRYNTYPATIATTNHGAMATRERTTPLKKAIMASIEFCQTSTMLPPKDRA